MAEVNTTGTWNEGVLYIALDGDYSMAIKDVSVAGGLINHGETGEAATLLVNFNQDVFKEGEATIALGVHNMAVALDMRMSPNPSNNQVNIQVSQLLPEGSIVVLRDMQGRELFRNLAANQMTIDLTTVPAGLYNVSIEINNQLLTSQKLVINK